MKKLGFGSSMLVVIGVFSAVAVLWVLVMPGLVCACGGNGAEKAANLSNMRTLGIALFVYVNDNNDRLPFADNWGTTISDEVRNPGAFNDPLSESGKFGYGFFKPVDGMALSSVENPKDVPLLLQTDILDLNAHTDLTGLPKTPRKGADLYTFLDSRVLFRKRDGAPKDVTIKRAKP